MIELKNIYKIYEMAGETLTALEDVSLSINQRDFTSIMGPSGSGKSTMMNVVGLLDSFDRGEYILNGQNISEYSEKELAGIRNKEIGFVFQSFNLMPRMSVLENVMLPLVYAGVSFSDRKERAMEALEKVGLGNRVNHRPNEISGGQKQRVAIARSIVNKPAVDLAAEPTGNADSTTADASSRIYRERKRHGASIILLIHDREVDEYTNNIVQVGGGIFMEQQIITPRRLLGGVQ